MSAPTGWKRLLPSQHELVDAVAVVALTVVCLAGFHSAFGGWTFLVIGLVGSVLGVVVAHLSMRFAPPALGSLLVGVTTLILLGGTVAVRDDALLGVVPRPGAFLGFLDGIVGGWRRLLTTVPPSGSLGNLLAISFACGFVGTWLTTFLARRPNRQLSLLALPGLVLAGSLLFGTRQPVSILVQGAVAAGLAIAWLAERRARSRQLLIAASGRHRIAGAALMLAVTVAAGLVVGPSLPLAATNDRFVLREQNEPPFDPRDYGSPLNAFQRYLVGEWKDEILFTVDHVPPPDEGDKSVYVRLAVMDDYDGVVWRVSPRSGTQGGRFIRVGESVPVDVQGADDSMEVTVRGLRGAWMPATGVVAGVQWLTDSERVDEQRDLFRLSTVTSTGIVPVTGGWEPGDRYRLDVVLPPPLTDADVTGVGVDTQAIVDVSPTIPEELRTLANVLTKGKPSPLEQAKALEQFFRDGYYASGDSTVDEPNPPGHSYARLLAFVADEQPVGNAEQFAAAMAIMARSLDLPARVVMGFRLGSDATEVRGRDVHAWVEIGFANGWKRFEPTSERREKPKKEITKPKPVFESQDLPPPPVIPPEPEVNARQGQETKRKEARKEEQPRPASAGPTPLLAVVGIGAAVPLVGLAMFTCVVLVLKRRRRSRRRRAHQPSTRMAGAWAELVDAARDMGVPIPVAATRREEALLIGTPDSIGLARHADGAVFGAGNPADDQIAAYWDDVSRARRSLLKTVPPWSRVASVLSTTSLRFNRVGKRPHSPAAHQAG
jgi:hypothetical protein